MAFIPSANASNLSKQISLQPNIILEIEGIPIIFGSQEISKMWKFDDGFDFDTPNLRFDTPFPDIHSRDYISLKGTSGNISQQVLPDKSGTSSTLKMNIKLIDFNGEVTELFFSGNNVVDLIGQRAAIYVGFKDGSHPEDSIPLINGYIDSIMPSQGAYTLSISHSENKKRQEIFQIYTSELTSAAKYKEISIQDISYNQRLKTDPVLAIEYILGGSTVATISGNLITITIINGVSTAKDVLQAINNEPLVNSVVEAKLIGLKETVQTTQANITFQIDTSLDVVSTSELINSSDILKTYVQVEDEIMEVVSIDSSTSLTVIRSRLNTLADSHESDSDISSVYGLSGNAIDLALKLYLSGGDEYYQNLLPFSFTTINGVSINDTIFFNDVDLINSVNVVIGDSILVSGASVASNNGTYIVTNITNVSNGSYITCNDASFAFESPSTANVSFKSQFNVLNEGCGLTPFDVDVQGHIDTLDQNFSSLPSYQFYLKEEINAKDFVDKELYFPSALYSINRGARISAKYTTPPLAVDQTPIFNSANIQGISKIKAERSTHRFMYNSIVYKYEESVLKDKSLAGKITLDPSAKENTDKINHTMKVESRGLRRTAETNSLITRQSNRLFQRYRLGATVYKNVNVLFLDSWNLEIGDVVEFGGEDVLIPDVNNGTIYTGKRFVEIINKSQNIANGVIKFDLLETGFDTTSKYGVISPSSYVTTNSTKTKLELKFSFYSGKVDNERDKWKQFVGQRIRIRNDDYTYDEITTINSLAPENSEVLNIDELALTPPDGAFITIPDYDETSPEIDADYKLRYTYNNHQAIITSVVDSSNFEISTPERFFIGGSVLVHSVNYDNEQTEVIEIENIVGNLITLKTAIPFLPIIGDACENMTFKDGLVSYRYI